MINKVSKSKFTIKAELHCHANRRQRLFYCPLLYDSTQNEEDIVNECIRINIKILAITDHDSMQGFSIARKIIQDRKLDILLIPACEISAKGGHILAYNIKKEIPRGLSIERVVDEVHGQGGIAVAAHPYMLFSYGDGIFDVGFDAIEGFNSSTPNKFNLKAVESARKLKIPYIVGSDAHQKEAIGNGTVLFPAGTSTISEVINNIKSGNFLTSFVRTDSFKLIYRHLYRNLIIQAEELSVSIKR